MKILVEWDLAVAGGNALDLQALDLDGMRIPDAVEKNVWFSDGHRKRKLWPSCDGTDMECFDSSSLKSINQSEASNLYYPLKWSWHDNCKTLMFADITEEKPCIYLSALANSAESRWLEKTVAPELARRCKGVIGIQLQLLDKFSHEWRFVRANYGKNTNAKAFVFVYPSLHCEALDVGGTQKLYELIDEVLTNPKKP